MRRSSGFTIVELLISTGVMAIILWVALTFVKSTEQNVNEEKLRASLHTETEEFLSLLRNAWKAKAAVGSSVGYSLLTAAGGACTVNCPILRINIEKGVSSVSQTVVFTSTCAAPLGAVSQPTQFAKYKFDAAAMMNGCVVCSSGQMPIVQVSRTGKTTRRFPLNGSVASSPGSPSAFLVNGIIGFSACYSQSGTGPLMSYVAALIPPKNIASITPRNINKSLVIPYTNFANIKINAN